MSHDIVNRFLVKERYEPKDLFDNPLILFEILLTLTLYINNGIVF